MSDQHFVYAEFVTPDEASRAVTMLVDRSIDPDAIDVLSVSGSQVERVPIQHHRPVLAGALSGIIVGMLIGLSVGLLTTFGSEVDAWATTTRWMVLGAACGFLFGALGGLVWWRSGVQIRGVLAEAQSFVVGTIVIDSRTQEVEQMLESTLPLKTGHYRVTGDEIARQHAQRLVLPTA